MTAKTTFRLERQTVRNAGTAAMFAVVLLALWEASVEPVIGEAILALYAVLGLIVLVSLIEDIRALQLRG